MFLEDCQIIENRVIAGKNYLMRLKTEKGITSKAGQFFMLACKNGIYFLRRPISLHFVDKKVNELEFYYEVKGEGTKDLTSLKVGDFINIQGPLGTGFNTNLSDKEILIVGGGMGLAPFKYLIDELKKKNNKITFIAGGRNKEAIEILSNFNLENIENYITTDDGSLGTKGSVLLPMNEIMKKKKFDIVFTCGPEKMMLCVAEIAKNFNIKCEVSLEARMACGVKACVGCSIKTTLGMKKVCHDGPVFNSEIILDLNPELKNSNSCCKN